MGEIKLEILGLLLVPFVALAASAALHGAWRRLRVFLEDVADVGNTARKVFTRSVR
jgi:hypothetical protein